MSLMTLPYVALGGPAYAILLAFLSGCVELLAGFLNLGKASGQILKRLKHLTLTVTDSDIGSLALSGYSYEATFIE